jgi:hypothetical protein
MQDIQEIFNRIQEAKKKQKDIKKAYKDALATSLQYQEIGEKLKTLRVQKKEIEISTRNSFSSEFTKLEDLQIDIESDQELLNDVAVSKLMKGESLAIKDVNDQEYEPIFSVKFKKVN